MELKVKKVRYNALLPQKATEGSAGYDLFACVTDPVTVLPGERVSVPTGIAIGLESSAEVGLVFARSGLAVKKGINLANGVGVIDSDYTGEIIVGLSNISDEEYVIHPQDRIAQLLIMPVYTPDLVEVSELDETQRGAGGFGSTGIH